MQGHSELYKIGQTTLAQNWFYHALADLGWIESTAHVHSLERWQVEDGKCDSNQSLVCF